jgi:hypothetical protein
MAVCMGGHREEHPLWAPAEEERCLANGFGECSARLVVRREWSIDGIRLGLRYGLTGRRLCAHIVVQPRSFPGLDNRPS